MEWRVHKVGTVKGFSELREAFSKEKGRTALNSSFLFYPIIYGKIKTVSQTSLCGSISKGELAHSCPPPLLPGLCILHLPGIGREKSWGMWWGQLRAHPLFHHLAPPFICSYTTFPGAQWTLFFFDEFYAFAKLKMFSIISKNLCEHCVYFFYKEFVLIIEILNLLIFIFFNNI